MQLAIIEVGFPGFEKLVKFVPIFTSWGLFSDPLNTISHEPLEEVIA